MSKGNKDNTKTIVRNTKNDSFEQHGPETSVPDFGEWELVALKELAKIRSDNEFVNIPAYNYDAIVNFSGLEAFTAALVVGHACRISELSHRFRRRYEISAGYHVAVLISKNKTQMQFLADNVSDGRSASGVPLEKVAESILHYTFIFIFHVLGGQSRNRATQYAMALQRFFDEGKSYSEAKHAILKFGPERLYRDELERKSTARLMSDLTDQSDKHEAEHELRDRLSSEEFLEVASPLENDLMVARHEKKLEVETRRVGVRASKAKTHLRDDATNAIRTIVAGGDLRRMILDFGQRVVEAQDDHLIKKRVSILISGIRDDINEIIEIYEKSKKIDLDENFG